MCFINWNWVFVYENLQVLWSLWRIVLSTTMDLYLTLFACDSLMTYGHIDSLMTIVLVVNYYCYYGAIKWKIFLVVFWWYIINVLMNDGIVMVHYFSLLVKIWNLLLLAQNMILCRFSNLLLLALCLWQCGIMQVL